MTFSNLYQLPTMISKFIVMLHISCPVNAWTEHMSNFERTKKPTGKQSLKLTETKNIWILLPLKERQWEDSVSVQVSEGV